MPNCLIDPQDTLSARPTITRPTLTPVNENQLLPLPNLPIRVGQAWKERKGPRFDEIDLAYLINHFSSKTNREVLTGSGSKTKVGGLSRGAEWGILSSKLSNSHNDRLRLTSTTSPLKMTMSGGDLMKQWNRIKSKYVETKSYWNRTGAGLIEGDEYRTIDEKKEGMCPMFKELDAIYGEKPNIKPLKVLDSMLPGIRPNISTSTASTSILPISQRFTLDTPEFQSRRPVNDISHQSDLNRQLAPFQSGSGTNYSQIEPHRGEEIGLTRPIPSFMDLNDSAALAAEAALFAFDYAPNTYNFARETYDYPHDTYDFENEPQDLMVNPQEGRKNVNQGEADVNENEMRNGSETKASVLNLFQRSRNLLMFIK